MNGWMNENETHSQIPFSDPHPSTHQAVPLVTARAGSSSPNGWDWGNVTNGVEAFPAGETA